MLLLFYGTPYQSILELQIVLAILKAWYNRGMVMNASAMHAVIFELYDISCLSFSFICVVFHFQFGHF